MNAVIGMLTRLAQSGFELTTASIPTSGKTVSRIVDAVLPPIHELVRLCFLLFFKHTWSDSDKESAFVSRPLLSLTGAVKATNKVHLFFLEMHLCAGLKFCSKNAFFSGKKQKTKNQTNQL